MPLRPAPAPHLQKNHWLPKDQYIVSFSAHQAGLSLSDAGAGTPLGDPGYNPYMPASRADQCPECGHAPLLPVEGGTCPECGFVYDQHTLIWRPRRPWRIYIMFANTLIFSPWLFRFLAVVLLWGHWPPKSVLIGAAISGGSLCWALPRLRVLLSDGHRYAAVTPTGVQARTPRRRYALSWDDIREITVVLGIPHIVHRDSGRAILLDWIFDTDQEVREFLEAIERGRGRQAVS